MRKYVIITDSGCDLNDELRKKYEIDYVPMHYIYNGKDVEAHLDWRELSPKAFYDVMRGGTRIFTAAVNIDAYVEAFEKYLSEGYDILSVSTTAALSTSVNSSYAARDTVLKKYPEAKVICVDSTRACTILNPQSTYS